MPVSLSSKNPGSHKEFFTPQAHPEQNVEIAPPATCEQGDRVELKPVTAKKGASPFFKLSGLDLTSIDAGIIQIDVPLKGGKFGFPGPYADADIRVRNNAVANLSLGFSKENGKTAVNGAHLTLNPPIKIKNPSAAFDPTRGLLARIMDADYIKDKVASVVLSGVRVSKDGKIHVEGVLKIGPLKKDLRLVMPSNKLPTVNLDLEALTKGEKPQFDLEKLLHAVGAMMEEATFTVKAHCEPRQIALNALGIQAWTEKASVDGEISGRARLTRHNSFHINLDDSSTVHFDAGEVNLQGEVRVADLASGRPNIESHLAFKATPNLAHAHLGPYEGVEVNVDLPQGQNQLSGHAFVFRDSFGKVTLKDASSLSAKLSAQVLGNQPIKTKDLEASLKNGYFNGTINANLSVDDQGPMVNAGEAYATFGARDLNASYRGVNASVPGEFSGALAASMWTMRPGRTYPNAHGSAAATMEPNPASMERVPQLRPFESKFKFDLRDDATLSVDPSLKGVSEFLEPITKLNLDPRVGKFIPGTDCASIGGHHFRKRCEEIGGAKVRHDNRVELLIDGKNSLPKRLSLINGAKTSICYQTMIFKDDDSGHQIASALCAAAKRGVDVKVIIDGLGNVSSPLELISENPIYQDLKAGGVKLELNGDSLGHGVRKVLFALGQSPKIGEIVDLNDVANPKKILSFLHLLAKAAQGESDLGLQEADRKQLEEGLTEILSGGQSQGSQDLVKHLANITEDNVLELVEVVELMQGMAQINFRWHEKYLVVDNNAAIVGGLNTADEYLLGGTDKKVNYRGKEKPAWRDTDVYIEGDAARDAFGHFADNWKYLTKEELTCSTEPVKKAGDYKVQMVHSRPRIDGDTNIIDLMIECLGSLSSGQKAFIESAYFIPTGSSKRLEDALIKASKRGVDVRVLVNSESTSDTPQVPRAAVFSFRNLLVNGVRIFERTGDRMMHSKVAVFGTKVAVVGSWNSDNRSTSLNSEDAAFFHSHRFSDQVEKMISTDMQDDVAREIKLDQIRHLPIRTELRNVMSSMLSDLM